MAYFEICPQCGSDDVSGNRKKDVARCETCGFESAASEALPQADGGISPHPLALDKLPSVIALPLKEYLDEPRPVLKLWHACDVIELMLRLLVMAGLADLRRGGELPPTLLGELRARIEEPTLGKWKGMVLAIVQHLDRSETILPELPGFVQEVLIPFLDGPAEGNSRAAEYSFTAVRNQLAHGGGVTQAVGARLVAVWQAPFAEVMTQAAWLADLDLIVKDAADGFGVLRGPVTQATPYDSTGLDALPAAFSGADEVVLARAGQVLPLWPFKLYGLPRSSDPDAPLPREAAPLIYVRRGEVRLQFTPVGSEEACQSEADETTLEAFRALLRLDEVEAATQRKGFRVRDFEPEIRKDADKLVGRAAELDTLRVALAETSEGVLWVPGVAGVGKSYLVARMATELLDAPPANTLVLPYRFRAGDDRCSRDSFVQFAIERLEAWPELPPAQDESADTGNQPRPLDKLRELLGQLQGQRVLFILDGLDEIAERDPDFARSVPLSLSAAGVLWLCAGRPERGLPEAFDAGRCAHPFPDGVPPMDAGDIRTMLLEKIGPLRKRLLQNDREKDERVINPFIEKVAEAADGLPLYVTYVVGDILNNRFRALDAGERLPPTLEAYHEELLRRCAVGTLHQVVTPMAATLAAAYEPLTAEMLAVLLQRRTLAPEGERGVQLVQQGLSAIASMLRRATTPEGDEGYTLFHYSLRQRMHESETTRDAVVMAREALCEYCSAWKEHRSRYALRHYAGHLSEAKRQDELFVLARDEMFRQEQKSVFSHNPALLLKTTQLALQSAAEIDDAGAMAEFMLSGSLRVVAITQESPLDALRAGHLRRAWELCDLCENEARILWYLLLVSELSDVRSKEQATATAERLLRTQLPRIVRTSEDLFYSSRNRAGIVMYLLTSASGISKDCWNLLKDRFLPAYSLRTLCEMFAHSGRFSEALATAQDIDENDQQIAALSALATEQATAGEFTAALATVQDIPDSWRRPNVLVEIAIARAAAGGIDAAIEIAQDIDRLELRSKALSGIAKAQAAAGEVAVAQRTIAAALATTKHIDGDWSRVTVLLDVASAQAATGESAAARQTTAAALAIARDIRNQWQRMNALEEIGKAQAAAGDVEAACATARELDDRRRNEVLLRIARAQAAAGEMAASTETLASSLSTAKAVGVGWHQATALLGVIAGVQAAAGELATARDTIATARDTIAAARDTIAAAWETANNPGGVGWHQATALFAIGKAQVAVGEVATAGETLAAALETALRLGDPRKMYLVREIEEVLTEIARGQVAAGEIAAALVTAARMKVLHEAAPVRVVAEIAINQAAAGEIAAARETLAAAQTTARDIRDQLQRMNALEAVGKAQTAASDVEAACATARELDDRRRNEVLLRIARAQAAAGEMAAATKTLAAALALAKDIDQNQNSAAALSGIAEAQAAVGESAAARQTIAAALAIAKDIDNHRQQVDALAVIAKVQVAVGESVAARQTTAAALAIAKDIDNHRQRVDVLAVIAKVQAAAGESAAARQTIAAVLSWAQSNSTGVGLLIDMARLQADLDDMAAARDVIAAAISMAKRIDSDFGQEIVLGEIVEAQADLGEIVAAGETAVLSGRSHIIYSMAERLSREGDLKNFKQLLLSVDFSVETTCGLCGILAWFYPDQAGAIANAVIAHA